MCVLQSSFLKFSARKELKGEYLRAFLGALVYYIPSYLASRISDLAVKVGTEWYILSLLFAILISVFVTEIFNVGFIRSLIRMKRMQDVGHGEKRYDAGLVLSGYTENFGNTIKIMLRRIWYLLGWGMLMLLPLFIVIGVIAFMSNTPGISGLIDVIMQYYISPTEEMAMHIGEYIAENCKYVIYMLSGAYILMLGLMIPYIRKHYEYIMIPMIVADEPDIEVKDAFAKTREIMHGFRWKYFCVEFSFIGWTMLATLLSGCTTSLLVLYAIQAAILPYINMTFIEFYKERQLMLMHDEEGEDKNEN